jgi:hypothetical protein
MNRIDAQQFCNAVDGCPRLNRRIMRATDAHVNMRIEMSPISRLARWLDLELPAVEDEPPTKTSR